MDGVVFESAFWAFAEISMFLTFFLLVYCRAVLSTKIWTMLELLLVLVLMLKVWRMHLWVCEPEESDKFWFRMGRSRIRPMIHNMTE